jgi:hypothetical protein
MDEAGESRGGQIDQRARAAKQFEENCAEEEPTLLFAWRTSPSSKTASRLKEGSLPLIDLL